ncbi:ribosomal protein S27E [Chryseomicrobium aureum]|uniref:hypothetical protein n=1 Tax=Chryseomicrobium aureum TaxID=1441723 RepID=UPI00195EF2C6|nr:hypothetical protein [Chryseomicrobium aureum]MBM7706348.1 ribosomal protein S27E [Chryseomicrobium aureum]
MAYDYLGGSLWSYSNLIFVQCPKCEKGARVFTLSNDEDEQRVVGHESKRLLCKECGYIKDIHPVRRWDNLLAFEHTLYDVREGVDWYFGLPLYLQTTCCGHKIWFLNYDHLKEIEDYIQKNNRPSGLYYLSAESRLPKWMKLSKNKSEVLKAISKVKTLKPI